MRRAALAAGALLLLLGAGCGVMRSVETGNETWVKARGLRPVSDSESLLMYFEYVRALPPAELSRQHDTVRQLYAASRSDFNRMRYAILLSLPGTAFNDDARALEALEPLLKSRDAALHNLAFMVNAQIQEQRRGQGLQQKLEALKSLEKTLIERDAGGVKRK
jgi:hypothetical protein